MKGSVKGTAKPATSAAKSELEELRAMVAAQSAQIADLVANRAASSGNRVFAASTTPREVADELLALPTLSKEQEKEAIAWYRLRQSATGLREIAQLFVKRIPGSPVDARHPFGQPVLVWNKNHTTQLNSMKDGVDRGSYIKLRNMVEQLQGDFFSYQAPIALSDDQINKVILPVLDEAVKLGVFELTAE